MPPKPPATNPFMERHTYIPPHVKRAMERHAQQSMPAHLKQYTQDGHDNIPMHAQQAMAEHMEQTLPADMKQYAGAYVQQQMVSPGATTPDSGPRSAPGVIRPASFTPDQNHLQAAAEQPVAGQTVTPDGPPGVVAPDYPGGQAAPPAAQPYDFIINPEKPSRPKLKLPVLPANSSLAVRVLAAVGGLLVLVIAFIIIKGLVAPGPNLTPFIGIVQDQQELIHLAGAAGRQQQSGISTSSQNFAVTTQLSITSSQSAILKYLLANGQKVAPKVLVIKVSATIDSQLTAATAATTYDQTFRSIMKTQLTAYKNALKQVYNQTSGKNGHALLSNDYDQANLLLTQLNAPGQ